MALRLVRQTSETPNITNKDDTIMTRYAYGGYNGIVKDFGNECGYTADNGIFKVLDGRIVIDGWEIDIDGAGWSLDLSTITGTQYNSVYAEIAVATESAKIDSTYLQGEYPNITKGDDLTSLPNGTARLLLYSVKVENGSITEVIKRFDIIPYLAQKVLDAENSIKEIKEGTSIPLKAKIAEYASEDTTKGTIEERLTRLGFKEGSVTLSSGTATTNKITRQGNYCILNVSTTLEVMIKNGTLNIGSIDNNFIPKNKVQTYCKCIIATSGTLATFDVYCIANIDTNGVITLSNFDYGNYELGIQVIAEQITITSFGYEATPTIN